MEPLTDCKVEKYIAVIESEERITPQSFAHFTGEEKSQLIRAGLLILAPPPATGRSTAAAPSAAQPGAIGSALSMHSIATAAVSGTPAAAGGPPSLHALGGGSGAQAPPPAARLTSGEQLLPTLPRVGPFLRLVEEARRHLLGLLGKSKHGEAPAYLLRERWDGGAGTRNPYGRSKDPFRVVLPGRTRKWKEFYGMGFDWVLAECVGSGLVEVFDTGAVGLGVRKT